MNVVLYEDQLENKKEEKGGEVVLEQESTISFDFVAVAVAR